MIPPVFVKLRIVDKGRKRINIWFPVILIWIPLIFSGLILLPFFIVFEFILQLKGLSQRGYLLSLYYLFTVLTALKGTEIRAYNYKDQDFVELKVL